MIHTHIFRAVACILIIDVSKTIVTLKKLVCYTCGNKAVVLMKVC